MAALDDDTTKVDGFTIRVPLKLSPRAKFMSKCDNFKRDMDEKEFVKLWAKILTASTNAKSLKSSKIMDQKWEKLSIVYDTMASTIYKIKHKQKSHFGIIKEYPLGDTGLLSHLSKVDEKLYQQKAGHVLQTYAIMWYTNLLRHSAAYLHKNPLGICDSIYVCSELLQKTLQHHVEERYSNDGDGVNEEECKLIIADLLDCLWTFHLSGNIHSDIKPENIMLRDREIKPEFNGWKFIDYDNRIFLGIRQKYKYLKTHGGTMGWLPPEIDPIKENQIFKGKWDGNYFSFGYDIWQIGLIILYIMTGTQPYLLNEQERKKRNEYKYQYKTKVLRNGKYDMDSDKNEGEIWIRNYILNLYVKDKISKDLWELLDGYIFKFDPRKRANCKQIYFHKWFNNVRE